MKTLRNTKTVLSAVLLMLLGVVIRAGAMPIGFFTEPRQVPGLESDFREFGSSISSDGKTIYFGSNRALEQPVAANPGTSEMDLYKATWDDANKRFVNVEPLDDINTDDRGEYQPTISSDGRTLYFVSDRDDGHGDSDLWQTSRENVDAPWGEPINLGPEVNSSGIDAAPSISSDNLTIYFHSFRQADGGLLSASRTSVNETFRDVTKLNVGEGFQPSISSDGLTLFFASDRPGGVGGFLDLWVTTPPAAEESFGEPINLDEFTLGTLGSDVNSPFTDGVPDISPDWPNHGSKLYFTFVEREGSPFDASDWDIYESTWIVPLMAGDADQDSDFDQLDLVGVQRAAKYLTGQPATWGEGDWNGAPGGQPGNPPAGDGLFDQVDIVAALRPGHYLTGPYAAVNPNGQAGDAQASVGYDARTGELWVDAPAGTELTSINIDSAANIFTGNAAQNLGGSFDNDADNNIFKATFGSSFGSLSFGNVAQSGLAEDFLLGDLTVVGSLQGGGALGDVDLIYVPEPTSLVLLLLAAFALLARRRMPSVR